MSDTSEILEQAARWREDGKGVALATVVVEATRDGTALGEFVVRARTSVSRDSSSDRNLHYMPEAEGSTRLPQQLCQLAKGSARLSRRASVNESDMALVRRVGFCEQPLRRTASITLTANLPAGVGVAGGAEVGNNASGILTKTLE